MRDHLKELENARVNLTHLMNLMKLNKNDEIILSLSQQITATQNEIRELEEEAVFLEEMREEGVVAYAVLIDVANEHSWSSKMELLTRDHYKIGDEQKMYTEIMSECEMRWPNYEFDPHVYGGVLLSCRRMKQGSGVSIYSIEVQPYKADNKLSSVWFGHVHG